MLGVRIVLMNGEIVDIGGDYLDAPGYDFLALIVGSEGQFGIVTEVTVRLIRAPEGARPMLLGFDSTEAAGACVAAIIAAGIVPGRHRVHGPPGDPCLREFRRAGYPLDVEALLIVEVEGSEDEIDAAREDRRDRPRFAPGDAHQPERGGEREIWKGRKAAFGAIGQHLGLLLHGRGDPALQAAQGARRDRLDLPALSLRRGQIFHAGDGNLHPLILYNANDPAQLERAELCGAEILKLCVELGGCLTGEHGVGIEKRELMRVQFTDDGSRSADAGEDRLRSRLAAQSRPRCSRWKGEGPVTGAPCASASTLPTMSRSGLPRGRGGDTRTPLEVMGARHQARGWASGAFRRRGQHRELSASRCTSRPNWCCRPAGTPLAEIEEMLAEHDQQLAFEPIDLGPCSATATGAGHDRRHGRNQHLRQPRASRPARRAIMCSA